MNRDDEKFILNIEVSDIIFKQHLHSYMPLNVIMITLQVICIITSLILQFIFKDISNIISYFMMSICLMLCILVVINNKIHSITWEKAKRDYTELFEILDDCFKSDYNVDDQTKMIHRIAKYKEKRRLNGKHYKK